MSFLRRYRKLHIWLSALAVFFAAYFTLRQSRPAMNWLCGCVLLPWEQAVARLCSVTEASVAEVLIISGLCGIFFYASWMVRKLLIRPQKWQTLYRFIVTLSCIGLSFYAGFCLFWGTFYCTDSFQQRSGLTARGGTPAELTDLTRQFAAWVADTADTVQRDEYGLFAEDRTRILEMAAETYQPLYEEFPFLKTTDTTPKAFISSRALSAMDFTGFYFPFTGESSVNVDSPAAYLGATVCHEMAHQRGIASEQECNFIGILAALKSDDPAYRYSGALLGYTYVSNALYRQDYDTWLAIRNALPESAQRDLRCNSDYWAQFEGPVRTVSGKVYDGFLKSNGDPLGVKSYGTVVDLLLAYYE